MRYYHISKQKYEIGDAIEIPSGQTNHFGTSSVSNGCGWIDEILNQRAPAGLGFNRNNCVYLFPEKKYCYHHAKIGRTSESGDAYYLYTVEANEPYRCLMSAIGLFGSIREHRDQVEKLADVYWNPPSNYKYCEYLCKTARVIDRTGPSIQLETKEESYVHGLTNELGQEKREITYALKLTRTSNRT